MSKVTPGYIGAAKLKDIDNQEVNALLHFRENNHISISVMSYESGTQIKGEALRLAQSLTRKRADLVVDLFLAGHRVELYGRLKDRTSH